MYFYRLLSTLPSIFNYEKYLLRLFSLMTIPFLIYEKTSPYLSYLFFILFGKIRQQTHTYFTQPVEDFEVDRLNGSGFR